MTFSLDVKVAVAAGGNGGIGHGMVGALAEAGAKVAIIDQNKEKTRTLGRRWATPETIRASPFSLRSARRISSPARRYRGWWL